MLRQVKFKTLLIIHLSTVTLALLRLWIFPFEDHLRYFAGHAICWVVVVSAVLAFFYLPKTVRLRKWIKFYFGVYLVNTCFLILYPMAIMLMFLMAVLIPGGMNFWKAEDYFLQAIIPKPIECESEDYIIRSWNDVEYTENNNMFYLYKKGTFTEQLMYKEYAGGMEYETYHAKRILEVNEEAGWAKVEVEIKTSETVKSEIQEWTISRKQCFLSSAK